jgi:hypothetical protein
VVDKKAGMHPPLPDTDALLAQFNKLIQELLRGSMNRNTFRPWEIEVLLDIDSCNLREANRREILRRYQKAVQRDLDRGSPTLMKMSEYLDRAKAKRARAEEAPAAQVNGSAIAPPQV